ncbi:divergent polysaccharide deacetylase family protein [Octadecabacter sp.]|nr:divergent polysaccharide deacetylase family protein [Octadecabacter sp.]
MRRFISGFLTGGVVSVLGLGVISVATEQPAGVTPPAAPLVEAPVAQLAEEIRTSDTQDDPSTPDGSTENAAPQAPDQPANEATTRQPSAPSRAADEPNAPGADTDPLGVPEVTDVEGALATPDTTTDVDVATAPIDPVLPNPRAVALQAPANESDLTVQVDPAVPLLVAEPDPVPPIKPDVAAAADAAPNDDAEADVFVVDLGPDATAPVSQDPNDADPTQNAPADRPDDQTLATADDAAQARPAPRVQLGGANTLLNDNAAGVTIRRPNADATDAGEGAVQVAVPQTNALINFSADVGDTGAAPLMSIILIDNGTMSGAAAALAALPFAVTIALDPSTPNATELMNGYRADGFEVVVLAKLPEGATPTDVEITFESVFANFPEAIALLDLGAGGLQTNRAVTEQAIGFLADQGRGFVTVSQGLNTAMRAAEQAGVPDAEVYRDLDSDGQDARVIGRFVDQAAFRARQQGGVVLVGRVRPDTISALILWGTVNRDDQVALVPVSQILLAQ